MKKAEENLFAPEKRPKILAVEQHVISIGIIEKVAADFGFKVFTAQDSADALKQLDERFYQVIFCNPRLIHGASVTFLGNIRSRRGYEKTPVIMITEDSSHEKNSVFLEEGADGYVNKPFTRDVLFAHLNLFIRRQIFQNFNKEEFRKRGLNEERGCIVLCCTSPKVLDIPIKAIETNVLPVTSEEELFRTLYSNNTWIVLIGTDAKWALPLVGKIKNEESANLQVILLRNTNVLDSDVVEFFNNGGDDITSVKKPTFILARQLNSRIEREAYYKHKYISALRDAAAQLPIRSEHEMQRTWGSWSFAAVHHTHEEIPGGDFYEVIELENGEHLVVLGDVMGKKWGAWFFSLAYLAYIRSILRSIAGQQNLSPGTFLKELNEAILRDFKLSDVFTTLTVLIFSEKHSTVMMASASGLPVIVIRGNSLQREPVKAKGSLLGFEEQSEYEVVEIVMNEGDSIILHTDGYSEINDNTGMNILDSYLDQYGADLMPKSIDKYMSQKVAQNFDDDRTLLVLNKKSGNG